MVMEFTRSRRQLGTSLVLLSFAACKSFGGGGSTMPPGIQPNPPTVISCTPPNGSTGIPLNEVASVTFSEAMNIATLNTSTFLVTYGAAATPVQGEVVCTNARAVFWPSAHFASNSLLTATITTGAMSAAGVPLVRNHAWTFTTGSPASVQLSGSTHNPARSLQGSSSVKPPALLSGVQFSSSAKDIRTGVLAEAAARTFSSPPDITAWVYQADTAPPIVTQPMVIRGDHQPAYTFRRASLRPMQRDAAATPPSELPALHSPLPRPLEVID